MLINAQVLLQAPFGYHPALRLTVVSLVGTCRSRRSTSKASSFSSWATSVVL
jgi:hypothetical protein